MAAFTLITSLLNTVEFHFLQPLLPCLIFDHRKVMESLCEKIRFLQAFLEDSEKNNINSDARRFLETQIRDVAHDAETKIESELRDVYYLCWNMGQYPLKHHPRLYQILQQVTRKIEAIEGRIRIENESNCNHFVEPQRRNTIDNIKAGSLSEPSSESSSKNVMIGCDDEFDTIKHKLISRSKELEVISIVGMGGIGKTTLVKRVYEDETIIFHFDILAWATASQKHNPKEMFLDLLSNILRDKDFNSYSDPASKLRQTLMGNRFLIVIDDIWSIEAWDDIHRCFPQEDFNGSRILLTTRLKQVADYASSGNNPHYMRFLNPNESWNLFYKKVYEEKNFSLESETICRDIVEKCHGLPLTIIVVAGLFTSSLNQWENIVENLNSLLERDPEEKCLKILSLSYDHLPLHLKVCFLYFGVFQEDSEVCVKYLIRLWIAEGFLKLELNKTIEEVAYAYLQDLIDRGLVQIHKWSFGGKIKSCKIHDVLHSFSLREAERENLLCVINENNICVGIPKRSDRKACRWISNQLRDLDFPIHRESYMTHTSQELRSFLCLPKASGRFYVYKSLTFLNVKLLRVLDISLVHSNDHILDKILDLVHLKYLALHTKDGYHWSDKSSIGRLLPFHSTKQITDGQWLKLQNLQTIIFTVYFHHFFPSNILDMPKIRHIQCYRGHYLNFPELIQENLQTLFWLSLCQPLKIKPDFKMMPNLKELGIYLDIEFYEETCSIDGLADLHQLENLKIQTNEYPREDSQGRVLRGYIKFPTTFPLNLKKLTFTRTHFPWEDMTLIATLPYLEVLKLSSYAFCGAEWKTTENGFRSLKYLQIVGSDLELWTTDGDHFPVLECLFLNCCDLLEEFPAGFAKINTLHLIDLKSCLPCLVTSAKDIQEERLDLGDDKLVLRNF